MKNIPFQIICLYLLINSLFACSPSPTKTSNIQEQYKSIPETITFPSLDGLTITANLYLEDEKFPFIVLCNQAGYNKSEYAETALILNKTGFNCLAIDQRSGGKLDNTINETNLPAIQKKLPTTYLDAEKDIIAAVNYMANTYHQQVILFGSSYSDSLALKIAKENENERALVAFSPEEYFGDKLNLTETIKDLNKPMFVTSSNTEATNVFALLKNVTSEKKEQFIPEEEGVHGASALKKETANNQEYWNALLAYLKKIK